MANGVKTGKRDVLDSRQLLAALTAVRDGDFSVRLPVEWTGISGKIADAFNDMVDLNHRLAKELDRVSRVVGREGKISQRASLSNAKGTWAAKADSINSLVSDLAQPTSEMARVIGAVAKGDLSQSMMTDVEGRPLQGEFLRTAKTVNTMVAQFPE